MISCVQNLEKVKIDHLHIITHQNKTFFGDNLFMIVASVCALHKHLVCIYLL